MMMQCLRVKFFSFMGFGKAYNRVPRSELIECRKVVGCFKEDTCVHQEDYKISSQRYIYRRSPGNSMKLLFVHYIRGSHGTNVKKNSENRWISRQSACAVISGRFCSTCQYGRLMCDKKLAVVCQVCKKCGMVISEKKTKCFL